MSQIWRAALRAPTPVIPREPFDSLRARARDPYRGRVKSRRRNHRFVGRGASDSKLNSRVPTHRIPTDGEHLIVAAPLALGTNGNGWEGQRPDLIPARANGPRTIAPRDPRTTFMSCAFARDDGSCVV